MQIVIQSVLLLAGFILVIKGVQWLWTSALRMKTWLQDKRGLGQFAENLLLMLVSVGLVIWGGKLVFAVIEALRSLTTI